MANKFDVNSGDEEYDLASKEDSTGQIFSMMLPMLLMIFLFSGCMAIAPESIAGEKERGTIATLLVTPMKRGQLAMGKIISLGIIGLLSGISSFVGTMLSLPKLMGTESNAMDASVYSVTDYILLLLVILTTVLVLVGALAVISAFAKTVKDIAAFRFRDGHAVAGTGSPHGDGGFLRFVQINELPVLIVITEFIPGADGIFQIGGFQRGRSPADAHFQRIVYHGGSGNCRQAEQSDDKKKGQSVLFHKTSQWRIP